MDERTPTLIFHLPPHGHGRTTTRRIMVAVLLALLPALAAAVAAYGPRALAVTGTAVAACLAAEYACSLLLSRRPGARSTLRDGSAGITGLLLALNLPAGIPLWQVAVGAIFAIGVAKMAFGGLSQNPFNPALAGRAFMMASFPAEMSAFPPPFAWAGAADATAAATPLSALKEGLRQGLSPAGAGFPVAADGLPDWGGLLIGAGGGCLGEASVAALAAGALCLALTRVINWEIPLGFLGALGLLTGACWLADPGHFANPLLHLLSGGALLGACFMATDPVTSPMSRAGRLVYALGGGLLCGLIRLFGAYPEGCSYAILLMNATVPLIDRGFHPRRYGHGRPGRRGEATP